MSLARLERRFQAWARRKGRGESTLKGYHSWFRRLETFLEEQGIADPRQVDRDDLIAFLAWIRTLTHSRGRTYAPSTQQLIIGWLRVFYRFLLEEGLIMTDPTRSMAGIKQARTLPKSVLSPLEMRRLLAAPDVTDPWGLRDRAILELLYGTGVRFRELTNLAVGDVDIPEKTLWIRQGKGRKDRVIPLGRWAAHWLGRYLTESDALRRQQGTHRVFLTHKGKPMANWVLNERLRHYGTLAGIKRHLTAHQLRHTFATQLIQGGADVRKIQRLLGHENLSSTQLYTHLDLEDLRRVQDEFHPRERRRERSKRKKR